MSTEEIQFEKLGLNNSDLVTDEYRELATALIHRLDQKAAQAKMVQFVGKPPRELDYKQEAVELIGGLHNALDNCFRTYADERIPTLFDSQEQFDQFAREGILALSTDQAALVIQTIQAQDQAETVYQQFSEQTRGKVTKAREEKDLPAYLMWSMEAADQYYRRREGVINETICAVALGENPPTCETLSSEVERGRKRFLADARLVKRMHQMLADLPDDDKIKIAILRLPAEVDSARRPRVLTWFPPNSFHPFGGRAVATNEEAQEYYCITDADCVWHSFDLLYKATRQQGAGGQFISRAFYLTSQSAVNAEGIEGFPANAKRFLEVIFADGTPPIPAIRAEMTARYPQVILQRNPAISREDIQLVTDGTKLHFILGRDEHGYPITQETIPYVVDSLVGGVGNAYNIAVDHFFH